MNISIKKAKKDKLFYFVVTGVIYRPKDGRCLILKRSEKEVAHPGLWSLPGGKLESSDFDEKNITRQNHDIPNWENIAEKLLYREIYEECGLKVQDPRYLTSIGFVRPDGVPAVLIKFSVKYKSGKVMLAPEFEDYAWVNEKEVNSYKLVKGIEDEVPLTISTYS